MSTFYIRRQHDAFSFTRGCLNYTHISGNYAMGVDADGRPHRLLLTRVDRNHAGAVVGVAGNVEQVAERRVEAWSPV